MEIIIYIIPFITAIILLVWFREETVWWEYLVLIFPSILFSLLLEYAVKEGNTMDTEYQGTYIVKTRYEEPWNEYIHRICHRTVRVGKHSRTVAYDCSYVRRHPPRWSYWDNTGHKSYFVSKEQYERALKKIHGKPVFVDMHRHYYTQDGDAYDSEWDKNPDHAFTMTNTNSYTNPFQANTRSLFKGREISKKEADSLGLYDYPKIYDLEQSPILGIRLGKGLEQKIKWLNASLYQRKNFRLYLLFFKNKSENIAELQELYWKRGNRGEVVCCIGLDEKNRVTWSKAFSWEEKPKVTIEIQNWFIQNRFNLDKFSKYIRPVIEKHWKARDFEDFSYVSIEISDGEYIFIIILTIMINLGISAWLITNEYKN